MWWILLIIVWFLLAIDLLLGDEDFREAIKKKVKIKKFFKKIKGIFSKEDMEEFETDMWNIRTGLYDEIDRRRKEEKIKNIRQGWEL